MRADFLDAAECRLAALPVCPARETIARETIDPVRIVRLRANDPPWRGTGIRVRAGQACSLFAGGTQTLCIL